MISKKPQKTTENRHHSSTLLLSFYCGIYSEEQKGEKNRSRCKTLKKPADFLDKPSSFLID
ncbi:hypothetical protein ACH95_12220 [Bacillus glycinifermentans]|uniref:Uncharacterized protein n=1 Tax=Bacillus glycinifermentans TaxID=1664069 RepID=A0A0J6EPJ5_9BACI|nr:hypothetical protein COP00_14325 [Bacillus glycinifermentans]KMM59201.1 hypothetical protein ACH95_12220 [Bacillus glycinifermentans]KRT90170.1 hypothetical protein AB447_206200 [Bacillus glycinifermentans]